MPILRFKQIVKYHEEYIMVFSKDIIKWKASNIESELKWDIYSELWESDDFYFLIQASRVYTLIHKRVFENQEEKQTFEDEIVGFYIMSISERYETMGDINEYRYKT